MEKANLNAEGRTGCCCWRSCCLPLRNWGTELMEGRVSLQFWPELWKEKFQCVSSLPRAVLEFIEKDESKAR